MSDIRIDVARPDDADTLLAIYAPYVEETAISFETIVPTVDDFRQRIVHTLARYPYLVAKENGVALGYAYTSPFVGRAAYDWSAETSIYIDRHARRQGLGRALYTALEAVSRVQHLQTLCACIAVPEADDATLTHNSVEFHAHMGYRMVGEFRQSGYKFGRWYNMAWMEKHIGSHPAPPAPIVPFPEIDTATLAQLGVNR